MLRVRTDPLPGLGTLAKTLASFASSMILLARDRHLLGFSTVILAEPATSIPGSDGTSLFMIFPGQPCPPGDGPGLFLRR